MAFEAKHKDISAFLEAEIASGKYGEGDRLPSETQLVRQFGVSRPTVARALLSLQLKGLLERRAGSGTFVCAAADRNPAVSTRLLGLLVPGLGTTEIFELISGSLASLARAENYTLLWGSSVHPRRDQDGSREHVQELCAQFIERRVTGVFFAPFELVPGQEEINARIAQQLSEAGIPVVLLDRDFAPYPHRSPFDLVGIDNFAAGFTLGKHLIKLGCKRIGFVARPLSAPTVEARIDGVRRALIQHQIEPHPRWVHYGDPQDKKFARSLAAGKFWDAFICANDLTAARLVPALEECRCRVPHDVRVAGFDNARYATLVRVPLTTINQPCQDIALTAFRAMLERIAQPTLPPRGLLLNTQIIIRESCGAFLRKPKLP